MADIELVIKMPENTYRQIQALARNGYFEHDICGNSMRRIANGKPLPKNHGRLIDGDALESHDEYDGQGFTKSVYKDDIDNAPTIIEADKAESEDKKNGICSM